MKTIKQIVLFVSLAIICSCDEFRIGVEPFYDYQLYVHILDDSGNDLIKRIYDDETWEDIMQNRSTDRKWADYDYSIVFSDSRMDIYKPPYNDKYVLGIGIPPLCDICGEYFMLNLATQTPSNHDYDKPADRIIYKLRFPALFGDDAEREIVTYWKKGNYSTKSRICDRTELEGKVFTKIEHHYNNSVSTATLRLENR
jgi:hypothetical protein